MDLFVNSWVPALTGGDGTSVVDYDGARLSLPIWGGSFVGPQMVSGRQAAGVLTDFEN